MIYFRRDILSLRRWLSRSMAREDLIATDLVMTPALGENIKHIIYRITARQHFSLHRYNRQFRYEERDANGVLHGRYGYYDQEGKLQIVNYTADPVKGFHAEGDHVPKPQY